MMRFAEYVSLGLVVVTTHVLMRVWWQVTRAWEINWKNLMMMPWEGEGR